MAPPLTATTASISSAPSMNNAPQSTAGSRSRNPSRRRPNDDAAYAGPSIIGAKRPAAPEKADGEPRVKRKRADALPQAPMHMGSSAHGRRIDKLPDTDAAGSPMDFQTMPMDALHRYLAQYDLIPNVHPSPLSALDPPPPSTLLNPHRGSSRALSPAITPANRPRRESREQSRRRSSRLLEEPRGRTPILADVAEVHAVLASIAQRHFEAQVVKEVDSLASFMCVVKAKGPGGSAA